MESSADAFLFSFLILFSSSRSHVQNNVTVSLMSLLYNILASFDSHLQLSNSNLFAPAQTPIPAPDLEH
jgi:hypothetical protein